MSYTYPSAAHVLRAYLLGLGWATDPPAPPTTMRPYLLYALSMPDKWDRAACVYNTVGRLEGRLQRGGLTIEKYGILIKVRAEDEPTCFSKIKELPSIFDDINKEPVAYGGTTWCLFAVHRTSPILPIGPEEDNKRYLYTINALVSVKERS